MDGIYQYDGEVPAEQYAQGIRAGDVKWRDVDDNNLINDNDRQVIGSSNPYFSGGWNNTFRYKGVSLDVFFTYMYGNDVYAAWKINTSKLGHKNGVLAEEARNRWTGPGSTDLHPRSVSGDTNNTRQLRPLARRRFVPAAAFADAFLHLPRKDQPQAGHEVAARLFSGRQPLAGDPLFGLGP